MMIVTCNNCDWVGHERELSEFGCPKCGSDDLTKVFVPDDEEEDDDEPDGTIDANGNMVDSLGNILLSKQELLEDKLNNNFENE